MQQVYRQKYSNEKENLNNNKKLLSNDTTATIPSGRLVYNRSISVSNLNGQQAP